MPSDRPSKPHGTFTPASTIGRVLTQGGYGAFRVSRGVGYGGHRCSWFEWQKAVHVSFRCGDDVPDGHTEAQRTEMIGLYEEFLTAKGYRVEQSDGPWLLVYPKDTAK